MKLYIHFLSPKWAESRLPWWQLETTIPLPRLEVILFGIYDICLIQILTFKSWFHLQDHLNVYCIAKCQKHGFPDPRSVLLRQRQVSNKVNFLLIYVSEKWHFCIKNVRKRYVSCGKWVQYVMLVMMGWKNGPLSVITFISPIRMNVLKTVSSLLKERSCGKTHVTLIQEMNSQIVESSLL